MDGVIARRIAMFVSKIVQRQLDKIVNWRSYIFEKVIEKVFDVSFKLYFSRISKARSNGATDSSKSSIWHMSWKSPVIRIRWNGWDIFWRSGGPALNPSKCCWKYLNKLSAWSEFVPAWSKTSAFDGTLSLCAWSVFSSCDALQNFRSDMMRKLIRF